MIRKFKNSDLPSIMQIWLTTDDNFVYKKYWNESENHFIEKI